eukprot:4590956-Pleurochrysis_carterae.AAC.1
MVELARHACSGDGTLDMERGQKLFVELFKRLSREATLNHYMTCYVSRYTRILCNVIWHHVAGCLTTR